MYGRNPEAEIFVGAFGKSRLGKAAFQGLLFGHFTNRFNKILVAIPIFCNDFANLGNNAKRKAIIELGKDRVIYMGKLQTIEPPTRL